MNFRKKSKQDDLEINFIPLIDVLLVIIIFLVVSTTFSKFSELKINLPTAEANQVDKKVEKINISISANGDYAINESPLRVSAIDNIVTNLRNAANSIKDPVIIISADSDSPHQSVINVMEAARIAGLTKITFSTKVNWSTMRTGSGLAPPRRPVSTKLLLSICYYFNIKEKKSTALFKIKLTSSTEVQIKLGFAARLHPQFPSAVKIVWI